MIKSDSIYVSSQAESNERIKRLGLYRQEVTLHILDEAQLSIPNAAAVSFQENGEYQADPTKDWIIEVESVDGKPISRSEIDRIFDYEWRRKFDSTIYGLLAGEHRWTFAQAGSNPETYSRLQVAVDVKDVFKDLPLPPDPKRLEGYLIELRKRADKQGIKFNITYQESISSALTKARKLVELYQEFNQDALIILQSEQQYNGLDAWKALQSTGLAWGDGDLFHWDSSKNYGHDQHFSVWTTTEPGYFLPEAVKRGTMNPQNLVFGFSIPRSADPENIFSAMHRTVVYCQKQLGGKILNRNRQPFDIKYERKELQAFLQKMRARGVEPGSERALTMF